MSELETYIAREKNTPSLLKELFAHMKPFLFIIVINIGIVISMEIGGHCVCGRMGWVKWYPDQCSAWKNAADTPRYVILLVVVLYLGLRCLTYVPIVLSIRCCKYGFEKATLGCGDFHRFFHRCIRCQFLFGCCGWICSCCDDRVHRKKYRDQ